MPQKPRVGLFVTCLVDLYRPNIGFSAVELLEQAGCSVEVPRQQTCCGQPAFNSGDTQHTRAIAQQVIDAFSAFDYLVGPSGSCVGTIKHHYPGLFESGSSEHQKALDLSAKSYELISFLTDVMDWKPESACYQGSATYHDSCSGLRELGIKQQPRDVLNTVQGLSLTEMDNSEVCCGFGGTFCVKYPEISTHMATDKVDGILRTQSDTVLGGDLGCLLNISGRLTRMGHPLRVFHIAEVLANRTDVPAIGEGEPET